MKERLTNIQISYNDKLGYTNKFLCFKIKTLTQLIPVLLLIDSILFFIQTFFR